MKDDKSIMDEPEAPRSFEMTIIPLGNKPVRDKLIMEGKRYVVCTANVKIILTEDDQLAGMFQYNMLTLNIEMTRAIPSFHNTIKPVVGSYPRPMEEDDLTAFVSFLDKFYFTRCANSMAVECVGSIARINKYHPVIDWLNGLTWDKQPRLDSWLIETYGAKDNAYYRAVGSKFLVAAVRRVKHNGCKFDQMLILEGKQGIMKSSSLSLLFGKHWFTDQISDIAKKDAAIDLCGKWCVEFGEIDQLLRTDVETFKAFVSRPVDHYRPPYARVAADFPRQCVFIGTTNSRDYLRDHTGNRRVWPVRCADQPVDMAWLAENRDQLWAEAAAREAAGEPIWLDDAEVVAAAEWHQATRMQEDPWEDKVTEIVKEFKDPFTTAEVFQKMSIDAQFQDKKKSNRMAAILRMMGYELKNQKQKGTQLSKKKWFKINVDIEKIGNI